MKSPAQRNQVIQFGGAADCKRPDMMNIEPFSLGAPLAIGIELAALPLVSQANLMPKRCGNDRGIVEGEGRRLCALRFPQWVVLVDVTCPGSPG